MNNTMKIVKSLKESGLLIKDVSETIKNEKKKKKRGFLEMFLGSLGASLQGNALPGKGTSRAGERATATSRGRGTIRAGQDF